MPGRERPHRKIPTKSPQPALVDAGRPGGFGVRVASGNGAGVAGRGGREVVVTGEGVTVYPLRWAGERWRAVWYEPDGTRAQCQAVTEGRLAAKLEPVAERLAADAPNTLRAGRELIAHYLCPDRWPVERQWSRRRGIPAASVRTNGSVTTHQG